MGRRVDKVLVDMDKYRGFVNLYVDGWGRFVYSGHRYKGCRDCTGIKSRRIGVFIIFYLLYGQKCCII